MLANWSCNYFRQNASFPHHNSPAENADARDALSKGIFMELTRRQFLGKTATAVLVAGTMASGKVFGANNRIRMCTIGFHGQGGSHIRDILGMKDEAEYVALCDVDSDVLQKGAQTVQKAQGKAPKLYKDIRDAL